MWLIFTTLYWTGILTYLYYNKFDILLTANEYYVLVKKYIKDKLANKGLKVTSIKNIEENLNVIEYKYNESNYIVYSNNTVLPYEKNEIEKVHNSKKMIKRDTDIIMGELVIDNSEKKIEIDILDLVRKLSGPLGNFYADKEGYSFEFKNLIKTKNYLEEYLEENESVKKIMNDNIWSDMHISIMYSDGETRKLSI